MLQLLKMHTQGQGDQEIHHPQHGRVRSYPYVFRRKFWAESDEEKAQKRGQYGRQEHGRE